MRLTLPDMGFAVPLRAGLPPRWRRRARIAGLALAGIGLLALLAVSQPRTGFGRLLMGLGLPGLAADVFVDPAWRAAALYEAGRYADAIALFRTGGRRASYNLGNALAKAGAKGLSGSEVNDAVRAAGFTLDASEKNKTRLKNKNLVYHDRKAQHWYLKDPTKASAS